MRRFAAPLAAAAVLGLLVSAPATGAVCPATLEDASASTPHVIDEVNDYDGVVFGNQAATVPYGDIYREGTDIERAWLARAESGQITAGIRVVQMAPTQPNTVFYFLWQYAGSDPTKLDRYVSAKLKGYGEEFTYGYLSGADAAGIRRFVTEGTTTGSVNVAESEVTIDVPLDAPDWGAPTAGSSLGAINAEARVLLGSPEPLPPNPAGLRSGLVGVADDTLSPASLCTPRA